MMVDRRQLITDLKSCVAEIIFHDDQQRHWRMRVTLSRSYLPEAWVVSDDQSILNVWDMDAKCWSNLPLENIISVQAMYTP
jgi:hypothetical protein